MGLKYFYTWELYVWLIIEKEFCNSASYITEHLILGYIKMSYHFQNLQPQIIQKKEPKQETVTWRLLISSKLIECKAFLCVPFCTIYMQGRHSFCQSFKYKSGHFGHLLNILNQIGYNALPTFDGMFQFHCQVCKEKINTTIYFHWQLKAQNQFHWQLKAQTRTEQLPST